MKWYFLFLIPLLFLNTLQAQDMIHKKNERIIAAKVLEVDSMYVYYLEYTQLKGDTLKIAKEEISNIKFDYSSKKGSILEMPDRAKNTVFLGLGGTGYLLSINYERIIKENRAFFYSARLGFGSYLDQSNINAHLSFNTNFGTGGIHYFEIGAGGGVTLNRHIAPPNTWSNYYKYYVTAPFMGYRIHMQEGFFFRVYLCPMLQIDNVGNNINSLIPMMGLNIGYSF